MSEQSNSKRIAKNTVISSLIWKFLERGGVQGVQFVLSIILDSHHHLIHQQDKLHQSKLLLLLLFVQTPSLIISSNIFMNKMFTIFNILI